MTPVTVHHTIHERKRDNLKDRWIDLSIGRKLVGIYRQLMELENIIRFEACWRDRAFSIISRDPPGYLSGVKLV